jgi:hypothetical protein
VVYFVNNGSLGLGGGGIVWCIQLMFRAAWMSRGVFFLFLLGVMLPVVTVTAQQGSGIGITPAVIEEPGNPGEVKERSITVTNLSDTEQKYYIYTRDIVGVKDDNSPVYAPENIETTKYELSSWISLGVSEIVVPPRGNVAVPFVLTVPTDAPPGSHFGAVFISVEPPRLRSTGAAVGYEVANIVVITVAGDAATRAEIREFSTKRFVHSALNVDFSVRIKNTGNVLVRPMGPLEITNMFGKRVAVFTFNESQGGVFPDADRDFEFNWKSEDIGFGRYEARVSPVFGDAQGRQTISSTVTFWVLPMNIIGPAAGVLAVLLLTIYIGVRLYVRRTVAMIAGASERRMVRTVRRRSSPVLLLTLVSMLTATVLFLIILLLIFA